MTDEILYQTDEAKDVVGSIRHAVRCTSFIQDDPHAWKWYFLALHSALQGACVCHLATTQGPLGTLNEKGTKEWLTYYEQWTKKNETGAGNVNRPQKNWTMAFPDLLDAIERSETHGIRNHHPIYLDKNEKKWLKRLHSEFRNEFIHFKPIWWTIEVSGLPKFGQVVGRIVKDIHDAGWAFRHVDLGERSTMVDELEFLISATWFSSLKTKQKTRH